MKLTNRNKQRLQEMLAFAEKVNRVLGISPKMEVSQGGNTNPEYTFDLRSLNQNLIQKR